MKPRIVRDNLQPVVVKVNQQVLLDVDIIGEPPPTVTWTFKDKVRDVLTMLNPEKAIDTVSFTAGRHLFSIN